VALKCSAVKEEDCVGDAPERALRLGGERFLQHAEYGFPRSLCFLEAQLPVLRACRRFVFARLQVKEASGSEQPLLATSLRYQAG
jgi:hypothetical protein